jgi:hypothetical protein
VRLEASVRAKFFTLTVFKGSTVLVFCISWGANEADKHFHSCGAFDGASLNYFGQLVCWL